MVLAITEVLGNLETLPKNVDTPTGLAAATRAGLSVRIVDTIAVELDIPRISVAKLLSISGRTLSRRTSADARLTPAESDRLVRLARILAQSKETLGSMEKASRWLQTPNRALEGDKPFDRLDTDAGVRSVEQVLGRIEYGLYS